MDPLPSLELLESTHVFPGLYQIKVIGLAADGFEARVLDLVRAQLLSVNEFDHSVRSTPDGRHMALTLVINAQSAVEVRAVYSKLQDLEGLRYLL